MSGQSATGQSWKFVARLASDAYEGETMILVKPEEQVIEGKKLLLVGRDPNVRQILTVVHVYDGTHVLLDQELATDFLTGDQVFQ